MASDTASETLDSALADVEEEMPPPPPAPVAAAGRRKREAGGSPSAERPSKVQFCGGWVPPVCSTCGQTAKQPDQFHPDNITLYWPKKQKNQAGHPESYPPPVYETGRKATNATRNHNFSGMPQLKLNALIEKNPDRMPKAHGRTSVHSTSIKTGRRRQHEQINISSYAAEESFAEFFNVGTVVPVGEWLESQGFDLKKIGNEAKQKTFAKEEEQHDKGSAAAAAYASESRRTQDLAKMMNKAEDLDHKLSEYRGHVIAADDVQAAAEAASMCSEHVQDESDDEEMDFSSFGVHEAAGSSKDKPAAKKQGRGKKKEGGGSLPNPNVRSPKLNPAASVAAVDPDIPQPIQPKRESKKNPAPPNPAAKTRSNAPNLAATTRSNAQDQTFKKAQALYDSKKKGFSPEQLWSTKPKQRVISQTVKSLDDMASKLTGDPTSSELQQQIIELSLDVSTASKLFTRLRQQPSQFLSGDLEEVEMQLLQNSEASLVATLVMWLAQALLKDLEGEQERSDAFFSLMSLSRTVAQASSVQASLLHMWMEKLFKHRTEGKIQAMAAWLPATMLDLATLPADFDPVQSGLEPDQQYSAGVSFDIQVVRTLCTAWKEARGIELIATYPGLLPATCCELTMWSRLENAARLYVPAKTILEECSRVVAKLPDVDAIPDSPEQVEGVCGWLCHTEHVDQCCLAKTCERRLRNQPNVAELERSRDVQMLKDAMQKLHITMDAQLPLVMPHVVSVLKTEMVSGEVDPWSGVKEQIVDSLATVYKDFLSLRGLVSDTDGNLTVESFCKASAAISKYNGSKCQSESNSVPIPNGLADLVAILKDGRAADSIKLPPAWCKSLIAEGQLEALLKLDASVKSSLGPVVEQQLRAGRIAHAYMSPQQGQADYLSESPTVWIKVEHVMQGVAALLDVQTAKAVHKLELPSLSNAEQRLIMKLAGAIDATKDRLQRHKSDVAELWAKLQVLLAETDSQKVKAEVAFLDDKSEVMELHIQGLDEVKDAQDMAHALLQWEADLIKVLTTGKESFAALRQVLAIPPDMFQFQQSMVAAMCHQLLLRDLEGGDEQMKQQAIADGAEIEKFARKELKLNKKDFPSQMAQAEKLVKDLKARSATS
ncbi:unnamed protein product [Symbiodinium sp. CCMP2592]|nr:unnamed protein product [Symbiodinium sp. CCMP2592]